MLQKDKAYHRRAGRGTTRNTAAAGSLQSWARSMHYRRCQPGVEHCGSVGAEITPTLNVCTGQISNSVRDRGYAPRLEGPKFPERPPGVMVRAVIIAGKCPDY